MRMGSTRAGRAALGAAAATGVKRMAHRFIVGETPARRARRAARLWRDGVASSVDLLGEATVTAPRPTATRRAARPRSTSSPASTRRSTAPAARRDSAGPTPRVNLSVKVSALTPLLRPDAPDLGRLDAAERLRPLLRAARDAGAHLHIDMETLDSREAVTDLVLELLAEDEFRPGRRPGSSSRPTCVTRLSCSTGSSPGARSAGARAR